MSARSLMKVCVAGLVLALAATVAVPGQSAYAASAPGKPNIQSVTPGPTTGVMTVRWGVPASGGSAITSYRVSVSANFGVSWSSPTTVANGSTTVAAVACSAAKVSTGGCSYRIYAVNAVGVSAPSDPKAALWSVATKPQNLLVNAGPGVGQATLKFAAPASNGGVAVTLYRYEYSLNGTSWALGGTQSSVAGTMVVAWCSPAVDRCWYRVRAYNAIGASQPSNAIYDDFDVPGQVQTIAATVTSRNFVTGAETVTWSWLPPDANGVAVNKYEVQTCPAYGSCEVGDAFWNTANWVDIGTNTSTTSTCSSGLVTCAIQVRAWNRKGVGATRHRFLDPFQPANPTAYTDISAPGAVAIDWDPPVQAGTGLSSNGYVLYSCSTNCGSSASWSNTQLAPGGVSFASHQCGEHVTCSYRVGVIDSTGHAGLLTNIVSADGSLFPGAPIALTAVPSAQTGGVDLTWQSPLAPAGLPVVAYLVERDTGSGFSVIATLGVQNNYSDASCGVSTPCTYRVTAANNTGLGASATAIAIGSGPPAAPTGIGGFAGAIPGSTWVGWQAPTNDGGHAVTSYIVQRSIGGGGFSQITTVTPPTRVYNDTTCGQNVACTYRVAAMNTFGQSGFSATGVITGSTNPAVPTNFAAQTGTTQGAVRLSWTAPTFTGGLALSGYLIERDRLGSGYTLVAAAAGNATSYVDKTCGVAISCAYRISAVNAVGTSTLTQSSAALGAAASVVTFTKTTLNSINGSYKPTLGDFNGDGYGDILWYLPGTGADALSLGTSGGSFVGGPAVNINSTMQPLVGDYNGDGKDDIFWYTPGTGTDYMWLGTTTVNGVFQAPTTRTVNGTYKPVIGNFNGDAYDDVIWYTPGTGSDYAWPGSASGFGPTTPLTINGVYTAIPGDFNGDGTSDIFWYAPGSSADYMRYGASGFAFTPGPAVNINGVYTPVPGDYDGDSRTDVVWYAPGTGADYLKLSAIGGGFIAGPTISLNGSYIARSFDFDGNSKSDLLFYSSTGNDYLWKSN